MPMHSQRKPLPLTVQHQADEPGHAPMLRTLARNGSSTFGPFFRRSGVPGNHNVAKIDSRLVAHLCSADPVAVEHASAIRVDDGIVVLGQWVRPDYFSDLWRRWCPACLIEHPYHRSWWDLTAVTACPFHAIEIVDRCECDKPLRHGEHAIGQCRMAHDLRAVLTTPVPEDEMGMDRYVVHRLLGTGQHPHALLDATSLGRAMHVVERIGRADIAEGCSVDVARARFGIRRLMSAGFHTLDDFPSSFDRLLDRLVTRRQENDLTSAIRAYGDLRYWLGSVPAIHDGCALADALKAAMAQHAAANIITPNRIVFAGSAVEGMQAGALAKDLGLSTELLVRLAKTLGMDILEDHPHGTMLAPAQAVEIRCRFAELESMEHVVDALGVRRNVVIELADLGHIDFLCRPFERLKQPKGKRGDKRSGRLRESMWNTWYFHPGSAEQFLERLQGLVQPVDEGGPMVGVLWLTKMFVPFAQVLRLVLDGDLPIRGIDSEKPGLQGLMVSRIEAQRVLKLARRDGYPLREAAPLMGMTYNQLLTCIKTKLVRTNGEGTRVSVQDDEIDSFKAKYARTAEIGAVIGIASPKVVIRHLRENGVDPLEVDGVLGITLYHRARAIKLVRSVPPPVVFASSREREKHQKDTGLPVEPTRRKALDDNGKFRSSDRSGRRRLRLSSSAGPVPDSSDS